MASETNSQPLGYDIRRNQVNLPIKVKWGLGLVRTVMLQIRTKSTTQIVTRCHRQDIIPGNVGCMLSLANNHKCLTCFNHYVIAGTDDC